MSLMAVQQASSSHTLAHFGNYKVRLSHSLESWILDSGASDHITGNPSLCLICHLLSHLTMYHITGNPSLCLILSPPNSPHYVMSANGSKVHATGIGQASLFHPCLYILSYLHQNAP